MQADFRQQPLEILRLLLQFLLVQGEAGHEVFFQPLRHALSATFVADLQTPLK